MHQYISLKQFPAACPIILDHQGMYGVSTKLEPPASSMCITTMPQAAHARLHRSDALGLESYVCYLLSSHVMAECNIADKFALRRC
jgi:hypothetical protein